MRLGIFDPEFKLLYHSVTTERLRDWYKGKPIYPITIEWFLTNYCNYKCNFCSFSASHNNQKMDRDIAFKVIDEISRSDVGVKGINFTGGGEPLLHPDYKDICEYAHEHGLDLGLFTNGSLLTPELAEAIGKTHRWVRFSIDAGIDRTFKEIKGVNEFKKVINNLNLMVEHKGQCEVGGGFVITKDNFMEIEMFVNEMDYCGVDYIQFKPQIHPYYENYQEEKEFWKTKVVPKLERASKNPKVMVNLYKLKELEDDYTRRYDICYGWQFCPCISNNKVYVCNYLSGIEKYCLGDLREKTFIQCLASQIEVVKPCERCQVLCKNHEINKKLYRIKHDESIHKNFL